MHFLADVFVPCEICDGKRFNDATLEILYKGHSIADVLNLSVRQASDLFQNHPKITTILKTLNDVGLSYVKLGQSATTLSGYEKQQQAMVSRLAKSYRWCGNSQNKYDCKNAWGRSNKWTGN